MTRAIRAAVPADAAAVSRIYAPSVSDSATSFETEPPDAATIAQRMRDLGAQYPWLVFEVDSEVLGYAYAGVHRTRQAYQWCVEASVYIDARTRRCGVGRALYSALFDLLRRQGYVNVYAGITLPNAASVKLHESMGFTPVGVFQKIGFKFGQWHDVAWLQLRLRDDAVPPATLLTVSPLLESADVTTTFHRCAAAARVG
jgi:L-amino acid N-acyltransferase YncA